MNASKHLIRRCVELAYEYHNGHLASALSALPIIEKIYKTFDHEKDVFVLSKGHGCLALYAVLEEHGYHPDCSKVHPDIDVENGISCTTGSLGHGLPMAVGMALAKKLKGEDGTVHVLLGDGECQEGTTWESLMILKGLNLDNIKVHIDINDKQALGDLVLPVRRFLDAIADWCPHIMQRHLTIKGDGVSFMEENPAHVHHLSEAEYETAMEELK